MRKKQKVHTFISWKLREIRISVCLLCQLFTAHSFVVFLLKLPHYLDFHPVQKLLIHFIPEKKGKKIPLFVLLFVSVLQIDFKCVSVHHL